MEHDLEERAADLAQIAIFNTCKECRKASDACEPLKIEVANLKETVGELKTAVGELKSDIKAALIWIIGILLTIIGSVGYIVIEQHLSKTIGG